jgi:asparagine synthase (glutamine-hydrolysing)
MFAIALWDVRTRALHMARDRFGEKPLYYGWVGSGNSATFVFGSELKALRAYPGFANVVSREALALYMRFTYIPAPHSIYQNIFKLEPGCILSVSGGVPAAPSSLQGSAPPPLRPPAKQGGLNLQRWWSLADVVTAGAQNQITDEAEAVQMVEDQLSQAVKLQSLADVQLGAFLSGGVDSSAIVALMQKQSAHPVKTFTIGFEEAAFDESDYARAVARHLGTLHTELYVTSAEAHDVTKLLPTMYDEPFADSSQIPTHLVARAAHEHVTVALSGDAGDELFGGYNRYFWGPRIWNRLAWLPYRLRQMLGRAILGVPISTWDSLSAPLNALQPGTRGISRLGDKAHKLAERLRGVRDIDDLYLSLVSEWQDPAAVVRGAVGLAVVEPPSALSDMLPANAIDADQLRMMYQDSLTYLPDDILCKVDRAAMATSLETRVPFLDHRLAELAWRLPLHMKIRGNEGKWALRQVLYKHVPRKLIERPKAGFGIPVGEWIRGPLRGWAESLLEEQRLQREGYFNPAPIRNRWAEHLSGKRDHTTSLWAVLMFQAWLEVQH